jgi:hypothetical protein
MRIPIVLVFWEDAGGTGGWFDNEGAEKFHKDPILVWEVGLLYKRTRKVISFSTSITSEENKGSLNKVPMGCVRSIVTLGYVNLKKETLRESFSLAPNYFLAKAIANLLNKRGKSSSLKGSGKENRGRNNGRKGTKGKKNLRGKERSRNPKG